MNRSQPNGPTRPGRPVPPPVTPNRPFEAAFADKLRAEFSAFAREIRGEIETLADELASVDQRVINLETGSRRKYGPRQLDQVNEQIVAWMRQFPGVRFTGHVVAENLNLDEMDSHKVRGRMVSLARRGTLRQHREPGGTSLFWFPKADEGEAVEGGDR